MRSLFYLHFVSIPMAQQSSALNLSFSAISQVNISKTCLSSNLRGKDVFIMISHIRGQSQGKGREESGTVRGTDRQEKQSRIKFKRNKQTERNLKKKKNKIITAAKILNASINQRGRAGCVHLSYTVCVNTKHFFCCTIKCIYAPVMVLLNST